MDGRRGRAVVATQWTMEGRIRGYVHVFGQRRAGGGDRDSKLTTHGKREGTTKGRQKGQWKHNRPWREGGRVQGPHMDSGGQGGGCWAGAAS